MIKFEHKKSNRPQGGLTRKKAEKLPFYSSKLSGWFFYVKFTYKNN